MSRQIYFRHLRLFFLLSLFFFYEAISSHPWQGLLVSEAQACKIKPRNIVFVFFLGTLTDVSLTAGLCFYICGSVCFIGRNKPKYSKDRLEGE